MKSEKINKKGRTYWFKKGTNVIHRLDGPAAEWTDGHKEWRVNGERHR